MKHRQIESLGRIRYRFQRARNNFNISVGERSSKMWKNCELLFICANYTKQYVLETIDHLEEFIRSYNDVRVIAIEKGVM